MLTCSLLSRGFGLLAQISLLVVLDRCIDNLAAVGTVDSIAQPTQTILAKWQKPQNSDVGNIKM
jgi:hypothetical protein